MGRFLCAAQCGGGFTYSLLFRVIPGKWVLPNQFYRKAEITKIKSLTKYSHTASAWQNLLACGVLVHFSV